MSSSVTVLPSRSEAINEFQKSYDFFEKNQWVDKYRYLTLLTASKSSYREMALNNIAFSTLCSLSLKTFTPSLPPRVKSSLPSKFFCLNAYCVFIFVFNEYIGIEEVSYNKYTQVIFTKKQEFNNKFFSKTQLKILNKVIEEFRTITAAEISELSHTTNAWKNVEMNEQITYESMVDDEKTSQYVSYIQEEKIKFTRNYKLHKLNRVS